jgi:ThiS family
MATYKLTHTGPIKSPHGPQRSAVDVPDEMTVRDFVLYLLERGDTIGRRSDYGENPVKEFMIIVNGMHLRVAGGPDLVLQDQSTIAILVPFVGG